MWPHFIGPCRLEAQRPIVIKLSCGRSVGLCICQVHCEKMADHIRMPCGIIGRRGPGMRHILGFGDRFMKRGTFGDEFGACHCNQRGLYGVGVWQCLNRQELQFGVVCAVGRGIAVLYGGPRRARGRGGFGAFVPLFTMGNAIGSLTVKCFRFVCENLTTLPFGKRIVGKLDSWTFWWYIQFQGQGVYKKLAKQ